MAHPRPRALPTPVLDGDDFFPGGLQGSVKIKVNEELTASSTVQAFHRHDDSYRQVTGPSTIPPPMPERSCLHYLQDLCEI
jgi:hypothetical protein